MAETRNGVVRIALKGDMDVASMPALHARLTDAQRDGATALLLDLREVTFMDVAALRAILQAKAIAGLKGSRMVLIGVRSPVRRLFTLMRSEFLLDGVDTLAVVDQFVGGSNGSISGNPQDQEAR